MRPDGRGADQLRAVMLAGTNEKQLWEVMLQSLTSFTTLFRHVLIELGKTRVICTASVNDGVPGFLKGAGKGWVTGEYGMLPRATEERTAREAARGKQSGRTQEIQRLIGRSLRAVTDQEALGERTVWLDCDVIEADGGTRTASITGAFVALALAMERMVAAGILKSSPLIDTVAATSVGIVDDVALLDLMYEEDAHADDHGSRDQGAGDQDKRNDLRPGGALETQASLHRTNGNRPDCGACPPTFAGVVLRLSTSKSAYGASVALTLVFEELFASLLSATPFWASVMTVICSVPVLFVPSGRVTVVSGQFAGSMRLSACCAIKAGSLRSACASGGPSLSAAARSALVSTSRSTTGPWTA